MHLMPLAFHHIKLSLTAPPPQANSKLHVPISTELYHNKQEMQLKATPLPQPHLHQPDFPVQMSTPSRIHIKKVLSSPLNTINCRKKKTSTNKRVKVIRHASTLKHIQPLTARALRQNAHFAQLPSADV